MAGLLKRLKDAVSTEAHDLLDSNESPDKIARQLVREATDQTANAQKLTIDAVASEKQLELQLREHSDQLKKSEATAALAMKNEDELGARRAIENKLHHQKLVDTLEPQLERARSNSESLKNQLASLQQKLTSLKSEQLAIEARFNGANATSKMDAASTDMSIADDTQSRLDRANSIVNSMEARNAAVAEVNQAINPNTETSLDTDVDLEMERLRNSSK